MASIEWFVEEFPKASQVYYQFWKLRITRVNICLRWQDERRFSCKNSLRRLAHVISSLCIGDDEYCDDNEDDYHRIWHDLFEFAAKSDQLAELQLFPENHSLTANDAANLIKWFQRGIAQVFEFKVGEFTNVLDEVGPDVEQFFYQAMFTSPLKRLKLSNWDFQHVDLTGISFAMEALQLYNVDFASMEKVIRQLEGSKVKELEIQEYADARMCLERLLRLLPRTLITRLKLTEIDCSNIEWSALAPLFAECHLEFLSVDFAKSIPPWVDTLIAAIQSNQTLCTLEFVWANWTILGVEHLIRRIAYPRRPAKFKRLQLKAWNIKGAESLKALAFDSGFDFVIVSIE
ncbi:unnamed protein product [Aphanomyces euteiches]